MISKDRLRIFARELGVRQGYAEKNYVNSWLLWGISYEPPSPPANPSTEIVDALNEATPEHLRDVGRYAEALAEHKERELVSRRRRTTPTSRSDQMTYRTTSQQRRRSRSRRSTTIATTTGSGGTERRFSTSQSILG